MALNFAGITLTARQEKLIRDNLRQPGQSIIEDALEGILTNCIAGSMTRAHERYVGIAENGTAEEVAALPVYTDTKKMLTWYFQGSRSMDQRISDKEAAEAARIAAEEAARLAAEEAAAAAAAAA
tara:strand:- start:23 stop:397 length:375 start_codon:yes stop_codon:yes gene_type:complete